MTKVNQHLSGWPWTKAFIEGLANEEHRKEFVADQVRTRIALAIKALRDAEGRKWSQAKLGEKMCKPANVVSRLENPDYGKMSLQTLLEVAAAFDLPLLVDFPSWDDWFERTKIKSMAKFQHCPFDLELFTSSRDQGAGTNLSCLDDFRKPPASAASGDMNENDPQVAWG